MTLCWFELEEQQQINERFMCNSVQRCTPLTFLILLLPLQTNWKNAPEDIFLSNKRFLRECYHRSHISSY